MFKSNFLTELSRGFLSFLYFAFRICTRPFHVKAFTWNGRVHIRNAKYKNDKKPLDSSVKKFDLNKYSKDYLNHLFNTNEMLGSMILTLNNINFYQELMFEIRKNIKKGTFSKFYNKYSRKL